MPTVTFDTKYLVETIGGKPVATAKIELRLPTDGDGAILDEFVRPEMVAFNEPLVTHWGRFLSTTPACRARVMSLSASSWEELVEQVQELKHRTIACLEEVNAYNALALTSPLDFTVTVNTGEPEVEVIEDLAMTVQEERERSFVMEEFGLDALPCSGGAEWVMENFNAIKGPYQATWNKMAVGERFKIAMRYLADCEPNNEWREWYRWAEDHGPFASKAPPF